MIADETGHTAFEVYLIVSKLFLAEVDIDGNIVVRKPTSLSSKPHSLYIERIHFFASDFLGMVLPEPNERPTTKPESEFYDFDRKMYRK